jgi:hypothetical protein
MKAPARGTGAIARTEEVTMRKIITGLFISLDGMVQSPSDWLLSSDEMWEVIGAGIAQSDAIVVQGNCRRQAARNEA